MRKLRLIAGVLIAVVAALAVSLYAFLLQLDLGDYREEIVARVKEATGRELVIAGQMDLQVGLTPVVTLEQVSMANAAWAGASEMAQVRRIAVAVSLPALLRGDLEIRQLTLIEPTLRLARNAEGKGNWELGPRAGEQRPQGDGLPKLPALDSLLIENARVSYTSPSRSHRVEIMVPRAEAERNEAGGLALTLDGAYQTTEFTLNGEAGSLETLLAPGQRYPVDLRLATEGAEAEFAGHLDPGDGTLRPDLRVSISGDLAVFRPPLAAMPAQGSYAVNGRVTGVEGGFQVEGLEARLGESDLSGGLTLRLDGPRPRLSGALTAARLDVAALWANAAVDPMGVPVEQPEPEGSDVQVFPAIALPFSALNALDAGVDLRIGALRLAQGLSLSAVEGRVVLEDGRLSLDPLRAEVNNAPLRLALTVDAAVSPAEISLDAEGEGIDYGRLMSDTGVTARVSGAADVSATLRGTGETPRALAETLAGSLSLDGGEGRLEHRLLDAASTDVTRALAPWREAGDDLRLNCVVARFDIEQGVMQSRALLADTQAATLGGEGAVSLRDERFDLRLVPHSKSASLMSLAVPVRLEGPLHDPHLAPDAAGAARAGALAIGSVINPIATIAALVVEASTAEENPCVAAVEQAAQGDGGSEAGGIGGFLEGLGSSIKRQLGGEGDGGTDNEPVLQERGGVPGP